VFEGEIFNESNLVEQLFWITDDYIK
jgi:hypothetical protein